MSSRHRKRRRHPSRDAPAPALDPLALKEGAQAGAGQWQIVWSDEPPVKPGQRVSKKREPAPLQALGFTLDEIAQARLAPIVNFKGRGAPGA